MKTLRLVIITALLYSCANQQNHSEEKANTAVLLSDSKHQSSCVYLTSDEKNNPVVSWCEIDTAAKTKYFFLSFFDQKKNSFSDAVSIPIEQNAAIHEEGMPKIAIKGDGTIIAVYETSAPAKGNGWAGFIHYVQSFDKGKTWSKPNCVHSDTAGGQNHSFASVTRLSHGEIGACWLDQSLDAKQPGRSIRFAKTNENNRFGNEQIIDSFACECCRTAISSDSKGNISIAFRQILHGNIRDMSVSTSSNIGKTFSPALSFSKDHWVLDGCPHNGPAVAADLNGSDVVWFTGGSERGVHFAELDAHRNTIFNRWISAKGRFIQLCLLPDGEKAIVYNETTFENNSAYSAILLARVADKKLFTDTITCRNSFASYPVVQRLNQNKVVVAWKDKDKIYYTAVNIKSVTHPAQGIPQQAVNPPLSAFSDLKLEMTKDPACGMYLTEITDTAYYKGKLYGFCSANCKNHFLKNPSVFLAMKE